MGPSIHPIAITTFVHLLAVCAVAARVIMRRLPPGVAFAWLFFTMLLPIVGALLYLVIGERRIGSERGRRMDALATSLRSMDGHAPASPIDWSRHPPAAARLDRLGRNLCARATVGGSELAIYSDSGRAMRDIARDIDASRTAVTLTFYIWNEGGDADEVLEALLRAARRGVACRVLVDAVGSRPWLGGDQPRRLRAAGVQVGAALPLGPVRSFVVRVGLRLHRKVVVVDNAVAWTGSMNLADPRLFKRGAGVGEWVDAMVRMRGAVVAPMGATALGDWMLETGTPLEELVASAGLLPALPRGAADVQVVPSGPGESGDGLLLMLLELVNSATQEVVLTTPYLVPDDAVVRALRGAAARGADVALIVPERVDSFLTRYASRSYFADLLDAGVKIFLYRGGLLHTKSVVVDRRTAMFGSVNLDMRSLWMNYEIALFVYDPGFAGELRALQQSYLADASRLEPEAWARRSTLERFVENSFRLVGPIL